MSMQTTAPSRSDHPVARPDLRNLEKVRGIFVSLGKFVRAQAIYQSNNPNLINSARAFEEAFRFYFENETELLLTVEQYQLIWREQVVYDIGCSTESIAFLLYKDGIGEISIHPSVKKDELEHFVGILKNALYNPSAQFDTATALWRAEFPNIFYRVLDEHNDGAEGEGDGSGSSHKEQPLHANDHQDMTAADSARGALRHSDSSLETLGTYLQALVDQDGGGASPAQKERHLQRVLNDHFSIDSEALARWMTATRAEQDSDEMNAFLRIMVDFTRMHSAPPIVRDVTDIIERLVHYIRDEGQVSTLIATLELQAGLDPEALEPCFASLPERIEEELTDGGYLLSLAKSSRESNSPQDVLRYLNLAGEKAVPAVGELLARSTDPLIHEQGCEVLIDIAGADILRIIEELDVGNPYLAQDVVYLLSHSTLTLIPPVIRRIVSASDPSIRRCSIEYLVRLGTDEAAELLSTLLRDPNQTIRVKTLDAVVAFRHPQIVDDVAALSFSEEAVLKNSDELEHLFRALGKLAGERALPRLRQTIEKKHYLPVGKSRSKRDKLLAITALRYIPGGEAHGMLEKLSRDADSLVKTKALHVLKQTSVPRTPGDESTFAGMEPSGRES